MTWPKSTPKPGIGVLPVFDFWVCVRDCFDDAYAFVSWCGNAGYLTSEAFYLPRCFCCLRFEEWPFPRKAWVLLSLMLILKELPVWSGWRLRAEVWLLIVSSHSLLSWLVLVFNCGGSCFDCLICMICFFAKIDCFHSTDSLFLCVLEESVD